MLKKKKKERKLHSIVVRLKVKKNEGTGPWGNEALISEKQKVMKIGNGFFFCLTAAHKSKTIDNRVIKMYMLGLGVTTVLKQQDRMFLCSTFSIFIDSNLNLFLYRAT